MLLNISSWVQYLCQNPSTDLNWLTPCACSSLSRWNSIGCHPPVYHSQDSSFRLRCSSNAHSRRSTYQLRSPRSTCVNTPLWNPLNFFKLTWRKKRPFHDSKVPKPSCQTSSYSSRTGARCTFESRTFSFRLQLNSLSFVDLTCLLYFTLRKPEWSLSSFQNHYCAIYAWGLVGLGANFMKLLAACFLNKFAWLDSLLLWCCRGHGCLSLGSNQSASGSKCCCLRNGTVAWQGVGQIWAWIVLRYLPQVRQRHTRTLKNQ